MRSRKLVLALAALMAAVCVLCPWRSGSRVTAPDPVAPTAPIDAAGPLHRLPTAFIPNRGQWDEPVRYVARFGAMTAWLTASGWTVALLEPRPDRPRRDRVLRHERRREPPPRGVALRMSFLGAAEPELVPECQLPGVHHYFLGNDETRWRSDVPLFGSVRLKGLYPGVDVRVREQDGHLEYDLVLAPGADLAQVQIRVEGADSLRLDERESLCIDTALGPIRQPRPRTWQVDDRGKVRAVGCGFVLLGPGRFGFAVPEREPDQALVIDPALQYSTYLGGSQRDRVQAIAVDKSGAATVAGYTLSPDFPTTPGAFDTVHGGNGWSDAFVTRLSASGSSLVYSTFLGGWAEEWAWALDLDAEGAATLAGHTFSTDFPTTPGAFARSIGLPGWSDAFVARLSSTGDRLVYATYLGGDGSDAAHAIALDESGAATVVGSTDANFPTTPGAYQRIIGSLTYDGFVTRLSPSGSSLLYSTYLGGDSEDDIFDVTLDADGSALLAGGTYSTNFPTTPGAFQRTRNGNKDAFVARLSASGASLAWSTLLGGAARDNVYAIALDRDGTTVITGQTRSADFPTTPGAYDTSYNGGSFNGDAFVARLSSTGGSLVYSTFLGGASDDVGCAVAIEANGVVTVCGDTGSAEFPTTPGAFQRIYKSGDVFVAQVSLSDSSLVYSSLLGGTSGEAFGVADVWQDVVAYVSGVTVSIDFPTVPLAFETNPRGGEDSFVTSMRLVPLGIQRYGVGSTGCQGTPAIHGLDDAVAGIPTFGLACSRAPVAMSGVLLLTSADLASGLPIPGLGIELWVDPSPPAILIPVFADSSGEHSVRFGLPPALMGATFFAQYLWADPSCAGGQLSASAGLSVAVQ